MSGNSKTVALNLLTGVQWAELSGNQIVGQFKTDLFWLGDATRPRPIETLLNGSADPENILGYAREVGPLKQEPAPGAEFVFDLQEFKDVQQQLGQLWSNYRELSARFRKYVSSPQELETDFGGQLSCPPEAAIDDMEYIAPNLYSYLFASLFTTPANRVRLCRQEECRRPYFIAAHGNTQFCGQECAKQSQLQWHREWWQMHGKSWRAKRRKETT